MLKNELRINDYKNVLDYISLSSKDIENKIKNFKLEFTNIKNKVVEDDINFPLFIKPFYRFIYNFGTLPTQEELYIYYQKYYFNFFSDNVFSEGIFKALKSRIYRLYPSLIRDIHFSKYVSEKNVFELVIYNIDLDSRGGIDLLIKNDNNLYGINLFINTTRSNSYRDIKINKRHIKYSNIKYIELPINFINKDKCGDFFLYGNNEYEIILNNINNG